MPTAASRGSESGANRGGRWVYNGESHATERDMTLHVLDDFRCTEAFGAEYVPLWLRTSDQDLVKGGLRVVGQREAFHARLMEERLRELGGVPRCEIPPDVRKRKLAFYGSTDADRTLERVRESRRDHPRRPRERFDGHARGHARLNPVERLGSCADRHRTIIRQLRYESHSTSTALRGLLP